MWCGIKKNVPKIYFYIITLKKINENFVFGMFTKTTKTKIEGKVIEISKNLQVALYRE